MERCLLLKDEKGIVSIPISESIYGKIRECMELSEAQVLKLFGEVEESERIPLAKEPYGDWILSDYKEQMDSIFVKDRDYFRRIDFNRIRWVEASGSYCCLYLENAPKMMLSFNLRELAEHLPRRIFVRVHRSYIVNIACIDSFIGNMLCIGKDRIPVSKQHKRRVLDRLNVLGSTK